MSADESNGVEFDHQLKKAKQRALKWLSVRNRTKYELEQRLLRADFSREVTTAVASWLISLGYLDDHRFAREWVDYRIRHKPAGRRMLAFELKEKGIHQSIVEGVLVDFDGETEATLACAVAAKRLGLMEEVSKQIAERKIAGYLSRRGFSAHAVRRALTSVLKSLE